LGTLLKAIGLVALAAAAGVVALLDSRDQTVQAAPVAVPPAVSSSSVPVGSTFTVTASWTDDDGGLVLETTAMMFA
jgi:hypothetical protein